MFRIRKISNPYLESNLRAIQRVKTILSDQFPDLWSDKIEILDEQLINPLKFKYHSTLLLAENINETMLGFALCKYMPDLDFCYLDYIATSPGRTSSGVGGALYQRVREESEALGSIGLFFECLPDDPALCKYPQHLEQNKKRLAFYERFGARPITNTLYETPVKPNDDSPPYLVFDGLGITDSLPNKLTKKIVRAILKRIYGDYCSEEYIRMVVSSIKDDPVRLRPFRYITRERKREFKTHLSEKNKLFWIINDAHSIHNIHQKGYVESPVRIPVIRDELEKTGIFRLGKVREFPEKHILKVHDKGYVQYFKKVCSNLSEGKSLYPYVFPIRNSARPPVELSVRAGYYCIDSFTPLNKNAYLAARAGVNCTLTAANEILSGTRAAYVLTRPPGHHAERFVFGGFCYFNNNAIAAAFLSRYGRVAILDIDYHHGNGQQQIFYSRDDILTISIHGHPSFAYPYFSGFTEEKGEDAGYGYNFNYPLKEIISGEEYRKVLHTALIKIKKFRPSFLIVAFGLDTAKGDPTGTWKLSAADFEKNGNIIGEINIPTLVIQEGGYKTQTLGTNAKAFFEGLFRSWNSVNEIKPVPLWHIN
jgi:acetoin utilization deacetylase AcuC-like enzyme/GNAT superfamily N-acetyltransferase